MAKLLLTTTGSRGDVHPLLAVATVARQRSHTVVFAVKSALQPLALAQGYESIVLPGSPQTLDPYASTVYGGHTGLRSLLTALRHYILPTLLDKVAVLRELASHVDLVVAPPTHPAAAIAAESVGTPWLALSISPAIGSPDLDPQPYPFPVPDGARRCLNHVTWQVGNAAVRHVVDPPVNAVRTRLGLRTLTGVLSPAPPNAAMASVAVSPNFVPCRSGWPSCLDVVGFCWWDSDANSQDAPSLQDAATSGRPFVLVTAGSIPGAPDTTERHFWQSSIEALVKMGVGGG